MPSVFLKALLLAVFAWKLNRTDGSLPVAYELSIADDPTERCRHATEAPPRTTSRSNSSLCFGSLQDGASSRLYWRAMLLTLDVGNKDINIQLKIRRVMIFAPGASFKMAGGLSVSVFSVLKDLELSTNFNGYGQATGPFNSSLIFRGQLNASVFEGHIIYHNLSRSHSFQCFHNNSLLPDFYRVDSCITCTVSTFNTRHKPLDPSTRRPNDGQPPCTEGGTIPGDRNGGTTGVNRTRHYNQSPEESDNNDTENSGFPKTGFSEYARDYSRRVERSPTGTSRKRSVHPRRKRHSDLKSPNFTKDKPSSTLHRKDRNKRSAGRLVHAFYNKNFTSSRHAKQGRKTGRLYITKKMGNKTGQKPYIATILGGIRTPRRRRHLPGLFSSRPSYSRSNSPRMLKRYPFKSGSQSRPNFTSTSNLLSTQFHSRFRTHSRRRPRRQSAPNPQTEDNSQTQSQEGPSEGQSSETVSCALHLVADHLFFREMGESSPAKTVNLMLSVIIGADAVFRATDFDGDGVKDNVGFVVKNITIIHNASSAFYGYSSSTRNSFQYLRSFSTGDFSDVCLGVAFTAIDFERGVVGLAWYASSADVGESKGGICGRRVYLANEGSSFSFNTAIVTFLNHGGSVSMEKAILTMAHEFGHCFGSSHDDMEGSPCNRQYREGSYLMHKYRPSRYFPNSYKFSPCSLRQMYPVLARKGGCLTRYIGPTCGNGILEEGEECDCGLSSACRFNDPCCTPGDAPPSSPDPPCTVRRSQGMQCSPVSFPCCSQSCKPVTWSERYVCREAGDCYDQARCDGRSPRCPPSLLQADGSPCHGEVRVCVAGQCRQSLCARAGLHDCFCRERPKEDGCKLCCRHSPSSPCLPAADFNITSPAGRDLYLPEGDSCLQYRGVCTAGQDDDTVRYCVLVDGLDGDFSALMGEGSWSGPGAAGWLSNTWFYFLLVPVLLALLTLAVLRGPRLCRQLGGWAWHGGGSKPDPNLLRFILTAQTRSRHYRRQAYRSSADCHRICSQLALGQQSALRPVAKTPSSRIPVPSPRTKVVSPRRVVTNASQTTPAPHRLRPGNKRKASLPPQSPAKIPKNCSSPNRMTYLAKHKPTSGFGFQQPMTQNDSKVRRGNGNIRSAPAGRYASDNALVLARKQRQLNTRPRAALGHTSTASLEQRIPARRYTLQPARDARSRIPRLTAQLWSPPDSRGHRSKDTILPEGQPHAYPGKTVPGQPRDKTGHNANAPSSLSTETDSASWRLLVAGYEMAMADWTHCVKSSATSLDTTPQSPDLRPSSSHLGIFATAEAGSSGSSSWHFPTHCFLAPPSSHQSQPLASSAASSERSPDHEGSSVCFVKESASGSDSNETYVICIESSSISCQLSSSLLSPSSSSVSSAPDPDSQIQ